MNPCPKCGYRRRDTDSQVHPDICPACGIAYSKWRARQGQQLQSKNAAQDNDELEMEVEADISRREQLWAALTSGADGPHRCEHHYDLYPCGRSA